MGNEEEEGDQLTDLLVPECGGREDRQTVEDSGVQVVPHLFSIEHPGAWRQDTEGLAKDRCPGLSPGLSRHPASPASPESCQPA